MSLFQITVLVFTSLQDRIINTKLSYIWQNESSRFRQGSADFNIITLSYFCQGLEKYTLLHPAEKEKVVLLIEDIIETSMSPQWNPYSTGLGITFLENRNLYLSHLSLMMSIYTRMSGENTYSLYNTLIYTHFLRMLQYSKDHHLQSYNKPIYKWPADNSVIYLAMHHFGEQNNYSNHIAYEQDWLDSLRSKYTDTNTGLPISEITGRTHYSVYPRGCANAWMVYYLMDLDETLSREYWKQYKKYYKRKRLLFTAFREYPPGVDLPVDSDSGPVILGYGSSASAISLLAARKVGDFWTWWQLQYSLTAAAGTAKLLQYFGKPHLYEVLHSPLALSLWFNF